MMDGVCDEIIKQGKLSKHEPKVDNSFIPVLADHITLKSDCSFVSSTFQLLQHSN